MYLANIDVEEAAADDDDEEYLDGLQDLSLKHTFHLLSELRRQLAVAPKVPPNEDLMTMHM